MQTQGEVVDPLSLSKLEFYDFKEAEYDLFMEWVDILLSQRKAEEQVCFEILVRVKDDCLRYLPDLKISFASQT